MILSGAASDRQISHSQPTSQIQRDGKICKRPVEPPSWSPQTKCPADGTADEVKILILWFSFPNFLPNPRLASFGDRCRWTPEQGYRWSSQIFLHPVANQNARRVRHFQKVSNTWKGIVRACTLAIRHFGIWVHCSMVFSVSWGHSLYQSDSSNFGAAFFVFFLTYFAPAFSICVRS